MLQFVHNTFSCSTIFVGIFGGLLFLGHRVVMNLLPVGWLLVLSKFKWSRGIKKQMWHDQKEHLRGMVKNLLLLRGGAPQLI